MSDETIRKQWPLLSEAGLLPGGGSAVRRGSQEDDLVCVRHGRLVIDEAALRRNVRVLRERTKGELIAVVKENGYGLGLHRLYSILAQTDVTWLGVTGNEEALALRRFGWKKEILMMTPPLSREEALPLVRANVVMALHSLPQAKMLAALHREIGLPVRVHVKIDTGMGRYGFAWDDVPSLKDFTKDISFEGVFSHLAGRPRRYAEQVEEQADRLSQAIESLEEMGIPAGMTHLSNSRAVMTLGDLGFTAVRAGTALLGKTMPKGKLTEAVWLESEIADIIRRKKGSTISYQSQDTLTRDSRLGLVRVGHGDGIGIGYTDGRDTLVHGILSAAKHGLRRKADRITAKIGEKRVPVLGKCGVAHVLLDLTDVKAGVGDTVSFSINPLLSNPLADRVVITGAPEVPDVDVPDVDVSERDKEEER